jgi:hypothetical protein
MKNNMLLISILIMFLSLVNTEAYCNDLSEINLTTISGHKVTIGGCFDSPCISKAGGNSLLFYHHSLIKSGDLSMISKRRYYFAGRTGENTFDIIYTSPSLEFSNPKAKKEEETTHHVYFEPNELFGLSSARAFPGCTDNDRFLLKMISLKGNSLSYQVILPQCLKNK